ncbi:ABC transporter ATP-binding protein [Variovorax terrae]|uniref:ABC transporter ATP-binding protein n=1 Tax=Variovorax terrae TaxID=2923278 RepID=A0A9X2ANK0_9BURK|nr:ABC transporter ATP-binding protein [Variovorax terrae]MCJ0764464.1 ABC transporter ATP-binding protein [Variovorax terrae]
MQHDNPLVSMQGVGKRYANGTLALDGMDLEIGDHEFVSFLGPSGCGKSTALRMIAGLMSPSAGRIRIGADSAVQPADVSFVFQEPTLMPWATVADNVALPLSLAGLERAEMARRVGEALEMVGLGAFGKVYPRELSGGMKMRVSIARAMVTRPKLLLMDEPFAALDEMTRIKLNNDVLALWSAHRLTTIFVTHSVYESVYLSSRIVVMAARPGRVVADLAVDAPYPRNEEFRMSAAYSDCCRSVSTALQQTLNGVEHAH